MKNHLNSILLTVGLATLALIPAAGFAQALYSVPDQVQSRWITFENPTGAKGAGGQADQGRKGSACKTIRPGETVTLADVAGPGIIRRIWCTISSGKQPELLRGIVLRISSDDQTIPSVEAPFQDFFGSPFALGLPFETAHFSNPEGRSFNCFVPMPFHKRARIVFENQSQRETILFYEVDCTLGDDLPKDLCYFHAHYRRENPTQPTKDFQILPQISGKGRFLGCNVGVRALGDYRDGPWFGEGEVKIYLDGDRSLPTLVGTGTEDFVGSGWGLAKFDHLYQGCLLTEKDDGVWGFYRYYLQEPVYFHTTLRVDLQQISGAKAHVLKKMSPQDFPLVASTHEKFDPAQHANDDKYICIEAPQDVCATAYWYQTLPSPISVPWTRTRHG